MGLFSSKKKIVVNVTVQPIFEEAMIPQAVKSGIMKYVFNDASDVTSYINEELIGCVGTKANTGFNWAKKNNYAAGIPGTATKSYVDAKSACLSIIANNVGQAITSQYYFFGPMNSLHYGWTWITNVHGYDAATNELKGLSASTGFKCYLKDMRATYTRESYDFIMETFDSGVLDQLGVSPRSGYTPSNPHTKMGANNIGPYAGQPDYEVSSTAVDDYVTVTYEFVDAAKKIQVRGLTVALTDVSDEDYHQVRYTRADGKTGFFTYLSNSGTYPGLDAIYLLDYNESQVGTYYPWMYFRVRNTRVTEDTYPELYRDCKKWGKYIGADFDMLSAGVHDDNDVSDVAQCILQLGVRPDSQHPAVIEYLFKHFTVLHETALSQMQMADKLSDKFLAFSSSPSQVQYIRDRYFGQKLRFSGITRKRIAGKIGKKGTYTGSYGYVAQNEQNMVSINPSGSSAPTTVWSKQPAFIYRFQVLDAMYEEIAVFGLKIDYHVHYKKGFGAKAGDPELLVPVDREIARTISVANREQVICRSMHMLVNTVVIIKSPWYASSFFKGLLLVVAIVVTVISAGSAWATVAAAMSISTWAGVMAISVLVLQYVVVSYAIKLFVQAVGPRIGFVAAIAAITVGSYMTLSNASQSFWGEKLLALGNGLTKEGNASYQRMAADMANDMAEFQEWAQGQFDTLQEKSDALGISQQFHGLTGFDVINAVPEVYFGEGPDDYYARTVHSGNIGARCYDMVEFYHSSMLQLPKLSETQELINGDV